MKLNVWLVSALAPLTAAVVLAQDSTPAAAAPKEKTPSVKKKIVLDPPAPAVVKGTNVNVRGQASFIGESLGHLQKGDTVTVLEQITLSHPKVSEPAEWAQIVLPTNFLVWVDGDFIDSATKTVKPRRVNLRGGPGENYSLVGRLPKGTVIQEVKTAKGWVAMEAPTNAFAYVSAEYLDMQAVPAVAAAPVVAATPAPAAPVVPVAAPEPVVATPAPAPVTPAPEPVVAPPTEATPPTPSPTGLPANTPSQTDQEIAALHAATAAEPAPGAAPAAPVASSEPVTPRIVTREGFVRRSYNIQSPTSFELHDIQSGRLTEYLNPKTNQNFKVFIGTRVTVTGAEGMDARWPRTPVLSVQSVDLMP